MQPIYYVDLQTLGAPINAKLQEITDADGLNKLMSGEWFGTYDIWGAVYDMMRMPKTSYDSEQLINELKEEISLYGEKQICIVYYMVESTQLFRPRSIHFLDYKLYGDGTPEEYKHTDRERVTLRRALELFQMQDTIA